MRGGWPGVLAAAACGFGYAGRGAAQTIPPLPDATGWGVHVLALARAPDASLWVGTYGQGIFVLRTGAGGGERSGWEHIGSSPDTAAHSISWDFVHAFSFGPRGEIWYGTVGNGWGLSRDGGRTWRNWELSDLGPEWQYVTPNGIVTRGDTTYVATADGIKVTWDDGQTWRVITDSAGAATARDSVLGRIQSQYVLAIAVDSGAGLWISTLEGLDYSPDGGRSWRGPLPPVPCARESCGNRVRALLVDSTGRLWVGTEQGLYQFGQDLGGWGTRAGVPCRGGAKCPAHPLAVESLTGEYAGTSRGAVRLADPDQRVSCRDARASTSLTTGVATTGARRRNPNERPPLIAGGPSGLFTCLLGLDVVDIGSVRDAAEGERPAALRHTWFGRPIALADQPYIDQTYRFGSTMGGNFQPHQGVEFNNPDGTPVHAIGDGVVVYSGSAEAGANTVAIRHDRRLNGQYVFSVYYHNTRLLTSIGRRVRAGDVIALVGNTGRATNDHLHLEVHVAPTTDSSKIVDPAVRYPPFNVNPELWIAPLPGTGVVAGQVWDGHGQPVPQARIYGLEKPEPQETPFSFIETYGPRNHSDPVYHEHFAISDVAPGEYVLGVEIEGSRVYRRIRVEPGRLTWVAFGPEPGR
jgi:murein DD-endopeptidase MepM/ murein hydrolase activator NlpD